MFDSTSRSGATGTVRLFLFALPILGLPLVYPYLIFPRSAAAFDISAVAWRDDLETAQIEAKTRDLLLWIQFTGPWCPNCRKMEREAFSNPTVGLLASRAFVCIKLRSDQYEELALGLGLTVLPSSVIVRPNGEVVDKSEGYVGTAEFLGFLERCLTREGRFDPLTRRLRDEYPGGKTEIALSSYCPVSLVDEQKLVPGKSELRATRDARDYRFASERHRSIFLARPERYVPVNRGNCPVRQVDWGDFQAGTAQWGVIYRGHLYLCADRSDRDRFIRYPERYADVALTDKADCPHCWGTRDRLARSLPIRDLPGGEPDARRPRSLTWELPDLAALRRPASLVR